MAHLMNVSCSCVTLVAKSKVQNDCGIVTSVPRRTSTGGCVMIGDALPKNGYVYLQQQGTLTGENGYVHLSQDSLTGENGYVYLSQHNHH